MSNNAAMFRRVVLLVLLVGLPVAALAAPPVVVVRKPTIVAFFPPVSGKELESDMETNESLSDFQWYVDSSRRAFGSAGIEIRELHARSFRIKTPGKRLVTFRPREISIGYYFVVPGKPPRVEYGVMTHADLFKVAEEYFGIKMSNR